MGVRKCIIKDCPSSSARPEDRGVTYHKIPANEENMKKWMIACRLPDNYYINKGSNVCSRHFRKADFQDFKGTKYVLKFGAVPTIFSWTVASGSGRKKKEVKKKAAAKKPTPSEIKVEKKVESEPEKSDDKATPSSSSSSLETENKPDKVDDKESKKIDDDKPVENKEDKKPENDKSVEHGVAADDVDLKEEALVVPMPTPKQKSPKRATPKRPANSRASASGSAKKTRRSLEPAAGKDKKVASPKKSVSTVVAPTVSQSPINFVPGTKIEAQDFSGKWHPAKIGEVDTEEREVLIQFEKNGKNKSSLNDEWIPMDSVRLRNPAQAKIPNDKLSFVIGEKCFARWSDSRKFPATIQAVLENEMYEVLFDDGFVKVCKASHISKLKKTEQQAPPPELDASLDISIKQEEGLDTTPVPVASVAKPITPAPIPELHIPQLAKVSDFPPVPKSGEWCCHWMNDFPIGDETSIEVAGVKINSIVVDDWRLPEGWVKHIYQRITTFGKLDIILVSPDGKPFRNRQEVKTYLAEKGIPYDANVYDFALHKKRSKELGFCHYTAEYKEAILPPAPPPPPELLNMEVNIGSVKVKIIDNLYQCPEPDCLKTFRKENHLQIHIKHYHKELAKGLGKIPDMQDLAALRTPVELLDMPPKVARQSSSRSSLKEDPTVKKEDGLKKEADDVEIKREPVDSQLDSSFPKDKIEILGTGEDTYIISEIKSPKQESQPSTSLLEEALESGKASDVVPHVVGKGPVKNVTKIKLFGKKKTRNTKKTKAGFISKPLAAGAAAHKKKKRKFKFSRDSMDYMDADETMHSFGTGGNDSFFRHGYGLDPDASQATTNASICGQYGDDSINSPRFISENGEVIKIVSMKKEEIINCLCGYGEEDGLMVQCELCLCWQHGICNGFERDTQVPDKYVCYICRNPQGVRESRRYIHDQDWLYEGKLPVANYHAPSSKHVTRFDILKQSHMLGGNLLELKRFMHSLKVKINIADKKDHPKLYLWSKKWESSPPRGGNGDLSGIVPLNTSVTGSTPTGGQKPIPQIPIPEAPIDPDECQTILLEHIQKQQNAAMARLQAMEAQIIALEAYDDKSDLLESPTAKNYPKTKQTIHMLLNDLVKLKKIAAIHRSAQQPPPY
ncbi:PHD finger protein 20-like protein 1 [Uranotaenia lowii]|uniref:PHD finger protein 20-like protein 1 n=1 Tax=Uranotaenia lowii TaxID=190385 RepID=UPI00247B2C00|nr:PHD finger protein 20-like protein 1 [Uranotaenia lowii]XP_055612036.1 PHD finger protein 20-like protein 1 [Uranotaenia lowii]